LVATAWAWRLRETEAPATGSRVSEVITLPLMYTAGCCEYPDKNMNATKKDSRYFMCKIFYEQLLWFDFLRRGFTGR
jgi:hypothetical protein